MKNPGHPSRTRLLPTAFLLLPLLAQAAEKRCGWLDNPTPQNYFLTDRDGVWTISEQGGYFVDDASMDQLPLALPHQFEHVNTGSYGYSCACLTVTVDRETQHVLSITDSTALPLKKCRKDPALAKQEPR